MKRVIITGGTGFVGANLTRRLLTEGHEVYLLVRRGYNPWRIEEIRSKIRLCEVDFSDTEILNKVVVKIRPEWIFHLATYGAYSHQTDMNSFIQTNIIGTINLIGACLKTGFEAFVNTGSSSEYGFKNHAPSETEWLDPNSYYAVTKAASTLFCRYTAQKENVNISTLRLYSVYGPYEEPTRLIPTLIMRGLKNELPPLVDPKISRDFVYIEDVENAFLLAVNYPNREHGAVYNVGSGIQTSMQGVVEVARRVLGITVEPKWGSFPDRKWDTSTWVSDNDKIKKELNWPQHFNFEEGFRETVVWLQENPKILDHYEKTIDKFVQKSK